MAFKNGVKSIQTAVYNGTRTVCQIFPPKAIFIGHSGKIQSKDNSLDIEESQNLRAITKQCTKQISNFIILLQA